MVLLTSTEAPLSTLALALGVQGVKIGKRVLLVTLGELVASLAKAERESQLTQRIRFLTRNALLIIDEVGYLPINAGGANLFFQLINSHYEHGALILTSNRGFSKWVALAIKQSSAGPVLFRQRRHGLNGEEIFVPIFPFSDILNQPPWKRPHEGASCRVGSG